MADSEHIQVIARNKRALRDYEIDDRLEAGLVLAGSEVKMLRAGKVSLSSAHVRVVGGEARVYGMEIPEYPQANRFNHEVDRPRKLLLHRSEIDKLERELRARGVSAPVLSIYWKGKRVKIEIGLGRGRRRADRRELLKKRDAQREIDRARKGR